MAEKGKISNGVTMRRLLASCFGLGWLPLAPGTWGSLPPAVIFALMCHFGTPTVVTSMVMAALALVASVVCIKFASAAIVATGPPKAGLIQTGRCPADPREVVTDEFAGQAVTFIPIGAVPAGQIWTTVLLGFLLFRLFDIAKPWPIRKLEKLPKTWGILADDLLAGVYASIALLFCLRIGLIEYLAGMLRLDGSSINILSATILGAIQGITEFLPISSSGHLVLFEHLFGLRPERPEMLLFDLAIHVGTVAAIFIVFRKSIAAFLKNLLEFGRYGKGLTEIYKNNPSVHFLFLAAVATLATVVVYKVFKTPLESARRLPVVASMWLVTGTLLLVTDFRKRAKVGLRGFGIIAAVVVGLAQGAAILPGISRSGATICAAILIGLRRRWAVEFSFLIAIPAILGGAAVKFVENYGQIGSAELPVSSLVVGAAAAFVVGIFALRLLIKTARAANLKFFAFYCYILAGFVLVYILR